MVKKLIILWALMPGLCFAESPHHPFIPQSGKLLIIGQQRDSIDGYLQSMGTVPGGVMVYTSIQTVDGLDEPAVHGAGIMQAQYYVNSYPHIAIQLALYMVGALDDTLAGKYDDNIVKLAKWMKNTDCPIYLRIGYEFDLPENHYDPLKYQLAYRYIVDHLRAEGVDNVAYVWHSASMMEPKGDFMDWYPGDDYVDWFAVSIFNSMQIATARKFFGLAREHDKQVMIAESAPAGTYSIRAKSEWYRHYFDFIDSEEVKIVSYINCDWDSYPMFSSIHWGDTRLQEFPEIKEMWIDEMNKGYIQYSLGMFEELR